MPSPEHHRRRPRAPHLAARRSASSATRSRSTTRRSAWPRSSPCSTCISGGRLVAGFPVGTPMDTNFCYGQIPALTRDKYDEAHDLIMQAWHEPRAVRLRRQVQPAALRELLAEADPEAAPADLHPRRRLDRDVGLLPRQRLQLLVPLLRRVPGGKALLDGYWERVAAARQGRVAVPRRLRADHLRGRHRRRGRAALRRARASTSSTAACTCTRASPTRRATARSRRSRPACSTSSAPRTMQHVPQRSPGRTSSTAASSSPAARDTVRERMEEMIKSLRVGTSSACSTSATCPTGRRATRRKLFAEKVMPQLRNMWPECDDDDRWWCKPLDDARPSDDPARACRSGAMNDAHAIETTRRGIKCRVLEAGERRARGVPARRRRAAAATSRCSSSSRERFHVYAPEWPGYGDATRRGAARRHARLRPARLGRASTRSALDRTPCLVGHSMGGMIAAEMACAREPRASSSWC